MYVLLCQRRVNDDIGMVVQILGPAATLVYSHFYFLDLDRNRTSARFTICAASPETESRITGQHFHLLTRSRPIRASAHEMVTNMALSAVKMKHLQQISNLRANTNANSHEN